MLNVLDASLELPIERLDSHGRGLASHAGMTVICKGALPGEVVHITQFKQRRQLLYAQEFRLVQAAEARVSPLCRYFGECGGCQLQHARYDAQLAYKESYLKQSLQHYGEISPAQWLPALADSPFHYRRRVRLGVRVISNDEIIIGFRRKHRSYLLDIQVCPILDPRLHMLLEPLHEVVAQLSVRHRLPQIEMSSGELEVAVVFCHLLPLSDNDRALLREFADLHQVLVFTRAVGSDSIQSIVSGQATTLQYSLPRHQIRLTYAATDFIQANAQMNELLVDQIIEHLEVQEHDSVLDLFCGIGNFSLPLARYARTVSGVEGHPTLVARARINAEHNGLRNVQFQHADLTRWSPDSHYNKLLLNPPRAGAMDVIQRLPVAAADTLVYMSCMPRTLARDVQYLVHQCGYTLTKAGVVDMFPQTRHVEAIAVLQR